MMRGMFLENKKILIAGLANKHSIAAGIARSMTEQGAKDIIEWSKSDDGYVVTREHAGFESIQTLLAEDKKTVYLYEKWASKEDHQAYFKFRSDAGLMDFLGPRLEGDPKITYFQDVD